MFKDKLVELLFFGVVIAFIIIAIIMAVKPDFGRPSLQQVVPKQVQTPQ